MTAALLTAALGLAAGGVSAAGTEQVLYQEDFAGGKAEGWVLSDGWKLTEYVRGKWALHGQGHTWANYTRESWGDYALGVRLNLVRGRVHVNFRLGHRGTRYFVSFGEDGVVLCKTVRMGQHVTLRSQPGRHPRGRSYWLTVAGAGGSIRVLVDGAVRIAYADPDPLPYGGIALESLDDCEVYVDAVKVLGRAGASSPLRWVRTGGPLGGLGYDVRMRPGSPDVIYVTDSWSGVNVSTDGGRTWAPSNEGIVTRGGPSGDAIPVFCLTIDPRRADVIWAGTQNARGIFKSADGGKTWARRDSGVVERSGITFRGFAVDPEDSATVYAAAEISSFAWAGRPLTGREFDLTKGVVYRTADGGESWQAIWRGDNLARYVCIHPRDRRVLYVSTGIFDREAANSSAERGDGGGVGVVKSTNGGRTWRVLGRDAGLENLYVGSLFMHPKDPDTLLAATGNNAYPRGAGVYLTVDGGESWKRVISGHNFQSVEFATSDPRIAYAASPEAIHRSEDGGTTWRAVTTGQGWGPPGVRAGFPIDIQVDPRTADRLFVNNYLGGNFLSADGGRTWQVASTGYTGAQVRGVAVDPRDGRRVFAAARSGLFVSPDGGGEWIGLYHQADAAGEACAVAVDPSDPRRLLRASVAGGVICLSRDGGQTWRRVCERPGPRMSWRAFAFAPSDGRTVYAGSSSFISAGQFSDRTVADGIHASRDGGEAWHPATDEVSRGANVAALAVDPTDPRTVYAATCDRGLLKSTDGGGSWKVLSVGPRVKDTRAVAVDPTSPRVVYVGAEDAGLYRSDDGGQRWQPCGSGMDPEACIRGIVIRPKGPRVVYAADFRTGVYRSDDGARSWVRIGEGLRTRAVQALALSSDGGVLYAATEGEGVFRLDVGPARGGAAK